MISVRLSARLVICALAALTFVAFVDLPGSAQEHAPKPMVPPQVTAETMKFWAFQPVRRPAVPRVRRSGWVRSPIDAFVLAKLEAKNLAPAAAASRTALIRRAYYDLTGLPPTPDAVRAFLADSAPDAYDRLIDRLLASPQYGEKWGRH